MERRKFIQGASVVAAMTLASQAKAQSSSTAYANVMDYGATGNGTTDDSSAFKSAVAALVTNKGGTLFLPAGNYLLNSTVVIAQSNIRIQGVGYESRIVNGQSSAAAIQFGDNTTIYYACGVFDVTFGQASTVQAEVGNCGLQMNQIAQSWIERCNCQSYPAQLYDGYVFNTCDELLLVSNEATSCLNIGFYWKNNCGDMYLVNARSDTNQFGFQIEDSQGFYVTNAAGFENQVSAWNIVTAGGAGNINLWFTNCLGDTSGSVNWNITNCQVAFFSSCWASTQINPATNSWAPGFYLNGANVSDISFSGGAALINNSHGVAVDGGASCISFLGFQFGATRAPGYGNGRGASGGHGLFIGTATDIKAIGCYFSCNNGYGINNGSGSNVTVSDCSFYNNKSGAASLPLGASSSFRGNVGLNPPELNGLTTAVETPSFPASGVAVTNTTGVECSVYITGGTVTNVIINGISTNASGGTICVQLGTGFTVSVDYSGTPNWVWVGR